MPNTGNATAAAPAHPAGMASTLADQLGEMAYRIAETDDGAALGEALHTRLRWLRGCIERAEDDLHRGVQQFAVVAGADPFQAPT